MADRDTENLGSGLSASVPFIAAFGVSFLTYIKRQETRSRICTPAFITV